jgi:hypothetical protein
VVVLTRFDNACHAAARALLGWYLFESPVAEAHRSFVLQPDFDPAPTTVRIHRCKYVSQCKARGCLKRASLIAEKIDVAGRPFGKSSCARVTARLSSSASGLTVLRSPMERRSTQTRQVIGGFRKI